ncbi:unnamed protein product [Echinostoma caproni]|uniref:Vacuolar protein sorting-associated protein 51 homolog n=1 Tax=Echinostoma caproni TaxID=27848 RepID=A0A183B8T0_9TREM|nr:unnamed protein product [Echinostoma caproni]
MVEKLTRMSDEASGKMKRAVFDNYRLFIKAGKAASQLEALMHEINSDFTEKERVINSLVEMSLFGDPVPELVDVEKELKVARAPEATQKQSEFAGSPVTALGDVVEGALVSSCSSFFSRYWRN